jgi:hypothetical protein
MYMITLYMQDFIVFLITTPQIVEKLTNTDLFPGKKAIKLYTYIYETSFRVIFPVTKQSQVPCSVHQT